ncbi:MAG: enoyl-CoA hydratase/isomerase family protein [Bacteroidota bacterium]
MKTYNNLLLHTENEVLVITVNRPDKLNALNRETIQEIGDAVVHAEKDATIAAIIITGAGPKSFVAGADIAEFSAYSVEEGKKLSADGQAVFKRIETCSKPVVAAVNGFALGGGCELAMACHLRIASDTARFGQPEVKLGVIPGYAGTQRLVQLIGKGKAMELLMTADMIGAQEALQLGLVNHVVPQDQLMSKTHEVLSKITAQSPVAIAGVIRSVDAFFTDGVDGFATEVDEFGKCFGKEDFKEGVAAFLEKRKPAFKRS